MPLAQPPAPLHLPEKLGVVHAGEGKLGLVFVRDSEPPEGPDKP